MVFVNVLMSAHLLPLVTAYQEGVNQDVCILTRLGHSPPDGDLGPVHAVMAPWLDRVGFRFVPQLCPSLVFSYALEYGRVDLLRELVATEKLHFFGGPWTLYYGAWRGCASKHRHLQVPYACGWMVYYQSDRVPYPESLWSDGSRTHGHVQHLAVAACFGGHVELLRFDMETSARAYLPSMLAIALRAGRLGIVQELLEKGVVSSFRAHDMQHAVTSGSADLVAFLLDNSSVDVLAEAFDQAATQSQLTLLHWLCAKYNDRTYWHTALQAASMYLRHDVIEYFATTHDLHLTQTEVAWVHRRRKRVDDDEPARLTRSRNY